MDEHRYKMDDLTEEETKGILASRLPLSRRHKLGFGLALFAMFIALVMTLLKQPVGFVLVVALVPYGIGLFLVNRQGKLRRAQINAELEKIRGR